jgi:hypothetical protein
MLLYIALGIAVIGIAVCIKDICGPDISIYDSPIIDAYLPPVEERNEYEE